jgi:hypothetical protein
VVSRIEVQNFAHIGNRSLLAVQTDAAINPGNSGGPVIQDDKVAGVAFQGIPGLENAGFFIPPPIIEHFLKDIADGTYDGFPQIGLSLAPLQSDAYRRFLKLPDDNLGARVDHLIPSSPAKGILQEDDVLLKIGDYPVGSDGTIVYEGNRVAAWVAVSEAQSGENIKLKIWRDGHMMEVAPTLKILRSDLAEGNQFDILPRYYVYGGLVFTVLSRDYLRTLDQGRTDASSSKLLYELYYHRAEDPEQARPEPVVLAAVLPHSVNAGLEVRGRALVDRINGKRIDRLADVPLAFEKSDHPQDLILFGPDPHVEALDRTEVAKAQDEILKTYSVPKDRRL